MNETTQYLLTGLQRISPLILDNLGIKINMGNIPEYKEYIDFTFDQRWYKRLWRKIFRRKKIHELHLLAQAAFMNAVIDESRLQDELKIND